MGEASSVLGSNPAGLVLIREATSLRVVVSVWRGMATEATMTVRMATVIWMVKVTRNM